MEGNKYTQFTLLLPLFLFLACEPAYIPPKSLNQLTEEYIDEYSSLNTISFKQSYYNFLKAIPGLDTINANQLFFENKKIELLGVESDSLSQEESYEYLLLKDRVAFNLDLINLQKQFITEKGNLRISKRGLFRVKKGRAWYRMFLRFWLSERVNPEDLYAQGSLQIEEAQQQIKRIQQELGYADDSTGFYLHLNEKQFYSTDSAFIENEFERRKILLDSSLALYFDFDEIQDFVIKQDIDKDLNNLDGFYNPIDQTFYYPFSNRIFNMRNLDWIYLHNVIPGIHFETNYSRKGLKENTPYRLYSRYDYPGFIEGWGVYTERLGKDLGLYENAYLDLGHWERDLVNSVSVVIDVGINYLGWSNRDALKFWEQKIPNQNEIALPRIKRIRDFPGLVQIFKYGAAKFEALKKERMQRDGAPFNYKAFHNDILQGGAMPFWMLEEIVLSEE